MRYKVGKTYIINLYKNEEFFSCEKKYLKHKENSIINSRQNSTNAQTVANSYKTNTPVQDVGGEQTDFLKRGAKDINIQFSKQE